MTRPLPRPPSGDTGDGPRFSLPTVALLVALLLLPIGVWTLAAQTSARFGALIPVGRARLMVGNVDIDVALADRNDIVLEATNMAPGDEVFGGITTSNVGSMAVRYRVSATVAGDLPDDWVSIETWSPPPGASVEDCLDGPGDDGGTETSPDPGGPIDAIDPDRLSFLPAGRSVATCLVVQLDRTTPNEAQNRNLDIAVVVDAVQDPSELVTSFQESGLPVEDSG
jgi:hypothetical protein